MKSTSIIVLALALCLCACGPAPQSTSGDESTVVVAAPSPAEAPKSPDGTEAVQLTPPGVSDEPMAPQPTPTPDPLLENPDETVVVVNGSKLSNKSLHRAIKTIEMGMMRQGAPAQQLSQMRPVIRKQGIQKMIQRELILQAAAREKIVPTSAEIDKEVEEFKGQFQIPGQFESVLEQQGWSMGDLRGLASEEMVLRKTVEELKTKTPVTDAETKTFYDENPEMMKDPQSPDKTTVSHILFKDVDDATALKVLEEVKAGGDFAVLATEYSACPSAARGGDLGEARRGGYVKEFEDAIYTMEIGSISDLVKTQFGYHIIKLVSRELSLPLPLEMISPKIKSFLEMKNVDKWLMAEVKKSEIEYSDVADKPAEVPSVETE
jgi:peptidyl-prolyl cis-trans isomerase C